MLEIVEVWIPIDVFKREFPHLLHQVYIQLNNMIVTYQLIDSHENVFTNPPLFFSLEDAWKYIQK